MPSTGFSSVARSSEASLGSSKSDDAAVSNESGFCTINLCFLPVGAFALDFEVPAG